MKLQPALEREKLRNSLNDWTEIILHREGKFYRAYNGSAFLVKNYVCTEQMQQERGDKNPLAVSRYKSKHGEYVLIGFPVEKVSKFIPAYKTLEKIDEQGDLLITIDQQLLGKDITAETLQTALDDWREAMPLTERTRQQGSVTDGPGRQSALARSGLFAIVSEVLAFPLEKSTHTECIDFLGQMRTRVVQLLMG